MYHAVTLGQTAEVLKPFISNMVSPRGLHVERLSEGERASFTVKLAECMSEMIDEEYGAILEMVDRSDPVEIS